MVEQPKRRPLGCRFWNAADLAAWIGNNVAHKIDDKTGDWQIRAALWFWAFREAEGFNDFRQKDFASMLVDGIKPMTARYVSGQLRELFTPYEGEGGQTAAEVSDGLEEELLEFYGLWKT